MRKLIAVHSGRAGMRSRGVTDKGHHGKPLIKYAGDPLRSGSYKVPSR